MGLLASFSVGRLSRARILKSSYVLSFRQFFNNKTNMEKAYFISEPEDKFLVTLHIQEIRKKDIQFFRDKKETIGIFLSRVLLKMQGFANKKKQTKSAINVSLLHDNSPLSDSVLCKDLFDQKVLNGKVVLRINESNFEVVIDPPWIREISFNKVLLTDCLVYPIVDGKLDVSASTFQWYKSKDQNSWQSSGSGFIMNLTSADVNHFYKVVATPQVGQEKGPNVESVSKEVISGPDGYIFEKRHALTKEVTSDNEYRVVSYNILADRYSSTKEAKSTLFTYCDPKALDMQYRINLIIKELLGYNADIICLQEVDTGIFIKHLQPVLQSFKFDGCFTEKGKEAREGVTCFYRNDKFKYLFKKEINLSQEIDKNPIYASLWDKIKLNEKFIERFKGCNAAVQVTILESLKQSENILVVGNTHLYFHPDADHVRLLQGITSFMYIQAVMEEISRLNPNKKVSMMFCGDFNSSPDSGFYELMTTGSVSSDRKDWSSNEEESVKDVSYSHSMKISSACGIPAYTNYTSGFKECIDYIYYQTDRLEVKQVVPIPSEEELSRHVAIPSVCCPSDHIALVADLKWKSDHNK